MPKLARSNSPTVYNSYSDKELEGDHPWLGGNVCSAVGGPRGTNFSATDVPGGPILGGTTYRMTDPGGPCAIILYGAWPS